MTAAPQFHLTGGRYEDLVAAAEGLSVGSNVPSGVAWQLQLARDQFVHMWFVYDFGVSAVSWSLVAVEAGLRDVVGNAAPQQTLYEYLATAEKLVLFDSTELEQLHAGRKLRNKLAHGETIGVLSPAMVISMLRVSHEVVARLYDRA